MREMHSSSSADVQPMAVDAQSKPRRRSSSLPSLDRVILSLAGVQKAVQGISGNVNPDIHLAGGEEAPRLRDAPAPTSADLDDIAAGIGEVCTHLGLSQLTNG